MSRRLLSMTLNASKSASEDSFRSAPDTSHNKGAIQFMELLEKVTAEQERKNQAVSFEHLVLQMMDVQISSRIPTPDHIAAALNDNGWSLREVSGTWKRLEGSHSDPLSGPWNRAAIDKIGRGSIVARVWDALKTSNQAGYPKRTSCQDDPAPRKRQKVALSDSVKVSNLQQDTLPKAQPCMIETQHRESPVFPSHSPCSSRKKPRRIAVPRRKKEDASAKKITWWFARHQDPVEPLPCKQESHPSTPKTPSNPSQEAPCKTKEDNQQQGCSKRRRRRKKTPKIVLLPDHPSPKSLQKTPCNPAHHPASTRPTPDTTSRLQAQSLLPTPHLDASPVLASRTCTRRDALDPSSVDAKKTFMIQDSAQVAAPSMQVAIEEETGNGTLDDISLQRSKKTSTSL